MPKCLLGELIEGAIAATEQAKEDEDLEQMTDHGLSSTQVKMVFDLIHI